AEQQLALARAYGVSVAEALPERVPASTVIVDALLGTGSRGAPRGAVERALRWLAKHDAPILAVDVPSGIEVDSGAVATIAAAAHVTVTVQRSKVGLHLTPARDHAGRIVVADIGIVSPGAADSRTLIDPSEVAKQLESLPKAAHK